MGESLQEYVDSRGVTMRVDRREGVLRGVKVLGLRSRNGRTYLAEALELAVPLYEGAKVNVNHAKADPLAARDYRDRIGNLRGVMVRAGEGLFADFYFNPKHALAEQLIWDAEHAPENVGFSHNVLARTSRRGDETVVEAITRVQSVDLVADPATTQGLFESAGEAESENEDFSAKSPGADAASEAETLGQLRGRLAEAEAELERLRVLESRARRQVLIYRLIDESGLSGGGDRRLKGCFITERFRETLLAAPDDQAVRELIRDRAELVASLSRDTNEDASNAGCDKLNAPGIVNRCPSDIGVSRSFGLGLASPRSRDQSLPAAASPRDAKAFVRSIT